MVGFPRSANVSGSVHRGVDAPAAVLGLVLAVLLGLPVAGAAQTISGQISGRITDSSGGVLPGVTVTVVNEGTGFTDTRVTDAAGVYTFTNLRVGTYSVVGGAAGLPQGAAHRLLAHRRRPRLG